MRNKLDAEEVMELNEYFLVEAGISYSIELVITGSRFRTKLFPSKSQWKASSIVLPIKPTLEVKL